MKLTADREFALSMWIMVVRPPRDFLMDCGPFFSAQVSAGWTLMIVLSKEKASKSILISRPSCSAWNTPRSTPAYAQRLSRA